MPANHISPHSAAAAPLPSVGAILAQGVIRLHERQRLQDRLDSLTEQSVSTGVLTTKGNACD